MNSIERVPFLKRLNKFFWLRYLFDSLLASVSVLVITDIIAMGDLYPRIPNISIVYLLVILAVAVMRGRYAAILASVVAFLSFDFFIVPPLYILTMYRVEEWIALFVFLITAILTSQLAVMLRERAEEASRREQETHILYDLIRAANNEKEPERQLQVIAQTIVDVFSKWGVDDCAVLLPTTKGTLQIQASGYQPLAKVSLSDDEQSVASWVMTYGQDFSLYTNVSHALLACSNATQRAFIESTTSEKKVSHYLRFLPLRVGLRMVGVLRLQVMNDAPFFSYRDTSSREQEHLDAETSFFWTFLDQVASLIDHVHLYQENMRIEVLQHTDALRAALLSSVSHDLQTPLTSIKAAASSLRQKGVQWDEESREGFLCSIEQQADRLNRLVGNLLDMSRIENGALKPEKETYYLNELIRDVVGRMRPLLHEHPVHLHLPDDLPPVEIDYLQIDQVLTNLIENVIRYTPRGTRIDIAVSQENQQLVMSVADRGSGIPLADRERIFDKFYRISGNQCSSEYPTASSGLGLAVCKGLVEAHGGRIWNENREGGGSIFFVTLPVTTSEGAK